MNDWELRKERDKRDDCVGSLLIKSEKHGADIILKLVCDLLDTPILESIERRISTLRIEQLIKEGEL